jgi:hypothetical protein
VCVFKSLIMATRALLEACVYIYVCMHAYMYTHFWVCVWFIYIYIYIYIYISTRIHTCWLSVHTQVMEPASVRAHPKYCPDRIQRSTRSSSATEPWPSMDGGSNESSSHKSNAGGEDNRTEGWWILCVCRTRAMLVAKLIGQKDDEYLYDKYLYDRVFVNHAQAWVPRMNRHRRALLVAKTVGWYIFVCTRSSRFCCESGWACMSSHRSSSGGEDSGTEGS